MKFIKSIVFVGLLCVSFSQNAVAQLAAAFSISTNSGCAPLSQVVFIDQSSGATSWLWDFGNGNTSTNNPATSNIIASYPLAGVYTAKLTITNANGQTSVASKTITVFKLPNASFSVVGVSKGCSPLPVTLQSTSILGNGSITSYFWDFNDGNTGTGATPSNVYTTGTYDVFLKITDSNGCTDTVSQVQLVKVSDKPIAQITNSTLGLFSCELPFNVNFTESTTGVNLAYAWDFGNGNTATTQATTTQAYNTFGSFNVSYTVTEQETGCATTATATVATADAVVNFVASNDTICLGAAVNLNAASSQIVNNYNWNFGDGTTGTGISVNQTYAAAGIYTVSLTANRDGFCQKSISKTIVVEEVTPSFTVDQAYACNVPHTVNYTSTSTSSSSPIVSTNWAFGNGNSGTGTTTSNTYTAAGVYNDQITVTTQAGCTATITVPSSVEIHLMTAQFTNVMPNIGSRCINMDATFTNTSTPSVPFDPAKDQIANVSWDFGDGTITGFGNLSSTIPGTVSNTTGTYNSPTHTYTIDSAYTVTMIIQNLFGCTDTSTFDFKVGDSLHVVFSVDTINVCASDTVTFSDSSYVVNNPNAVVDFWQWTNINGAFDFGGTTLTVPFSPARDTGWMDVKLITGYYGCYDTLDSTKVVFFNGPVLKNLDTTFFCSDPFARTFSATFIDTTSYLWVFGDGDTLFNFNNGGVIPVGTNSGRTSGIYSNPKHTYAAVGSYDVTLIAFNGTKFPFAGDSCRFEESLAFKVEIRNIKAIMDFPNDSVCLDLAVNFIGSNSIDATAYNWSFGDGGTATIANPSHTYAVGGQYGVTLTATDVNGCFNELDSIIKVFKPLAAFAADTTSGCVPLTINFTDTTVSSTTINQWLWTNGGAFISAAQNPTVVINQSGVQTIQLKITDEFACESTKTLIIEAFQPIVDFTISDVTLCALTDVQFTDTSTPYVTASGTTLTITSWAWNFGGDSTSTLQNPSNSYLLLGDMSPSLTITDNLGCTNTITKTNGLNVQAIPVAAFSSDSAQIATCYPYTPNFLNNTIHDSISSVHWSFGDGTSSIVNNPNHTYNSPGLYSIELIIETTFGCKDTLTQTNYFDVSGPLATFSSDIDFLCKGTSATFTVQNSQGVFNYEWDFGDGQGVSGANDTTVSHVFNRFGTNIIVLNIFDSTGTCKIPIIDSVNVLNVIADFSISDTAGCSGLDVLFTDASTGVSNSGGSWSWDFGNGNTSSSQIPPIQIYTAPIDSVMLAVSQTLSNSTGPVTCYDTIRKHIDIYANPIVAFSSDSVICEGNQVVLEATQGFASYAWATNSTLSDTSIYNPTASPITTTSYSVTVAELHNGGSITCTGTTAYTITVINKADFDLKESKTIAIGDIDTLIGSLVDTTGFSYTWVTDQVLTGTDSLTPIFNSASNGYTGLDPVSYDFTLEVQDVNRICPVQSKTVTLEVVAQFAIDVPTAFTPNGDNINDVLYVDGWGIKELQEYKIYDRWGQLIYNNPGDIEQGWDGTYKGKPQNMDTYIVIVKGIYFNDEPALLKKGKQYITLVR